MTQKYSIAIMPKWYFNFLHIDCQGNIKTFFLSLSFLQFHQSFVTVCRKWSISLFPEKNGSLNKFQRKIQIKICRRKKFLLNVSRSKYLSVTCKLKLFEIRKDPQIILNRAYIIFDKIRKSKIIFRLNSF